MLTCRQNNLTGVDYMKLYIMVKYNLEALQTRVGPSRAHSSTKAQRFPLVLHRMSHVHLDVVPKLLGKHVNFSFSTESR